MLRSLLRLGAAAPALALCACAANMGKPLEPEVIAAEPGLLAERLVASANQHAVRCTFESPTGTRVRRQLCLTEAEHALREQFDEWLFYESLRGNPNPR